jgi:hypothetical protein
VREGTKINSGRRTWKGREGERKEEGKEKGKGKRKEEEKGKGKGKGKGEEGREGSRWRTKVIKPEDHTGRPSRQCRSTEDSRGRFS